MTQPIDAHGPSDGIARIYSEIQDLYGVAYVSAIHHQLAGWPGFLEWAWASVAPVFRNGAAQQAAQRCADAVSLSPLAPIPPAALRAWGMDSAALARLRAATDGFVRVAPINMVFAGLVKALLEGAQPNGAKTTAGGRALPATLPSPPDMIDLAETDDIRRDLALSFASDLAGKPFVPGLYRMIIHWPGLAGHLATVLRPRLAASEAVAAYDGLRAAIDATVLELLAELPVVDTPFAMPASAERSRFLEVGQTYRKTSPELVVAGRLIGGALPKEV